ncbi:hypothetical protein CBF23_005060 [Marinomonas agarivorans]|nr:hypothetical protein CBF23_005060 [Marinomonas agarivorans]
MFITVLAATYATGNKGKDVTNQVQALVLNGQTSFQVNNTTMKGDPDVGTVKHFSMTYIKDEGPIHYRGVREGDTVTI